MWFCCCWLFQVWVWVCSVLVGASGASTLSLSLVVLCCVVLSLYSSVVAARFAPPLQSLPTLTHSLTLVGWLAGLPACFLHSFLLFLLFIPLPKSCFVCFSPVSLCGGGGGASLLFAGRREEQGFAGLPRAMASSSYAIKEEDHEVRCFRNPTNASSSSLSVPVCCCCAVCVLEGPRCFAALDQSAAAGDLGFMGLGFGELCARGGCFV